MAVAAPSRAIPAQEEQPPRPAGNGTVRDAARRRANGSGHVSAAADGRATPHRERQACCGLYHRAIELIGKRWTGAILLVLTDGSLRFSEIRHLVPDLSDRLLSERLKELEAEGMVARNVIDEMPVKVEYALTPKARALEPALRSIKGWAHEWLAHPNGNGHHDTVRGPTPSS